MAPDALRPFVDDARRPGRRPLLSTASNLCLHPFGDGKGAFMKRVLFLAYILACSVPLLLPRVTTSAQDFCRDKKFG
jgi:hypothetical protein